MRVLVCGDRNWTDEALLFSVLDRVHAARGITCVIEGEAKGADILGRKWAEMRSVPVVAYPAKWKEYGRAAGPIRNKQMLDEGKPGLVLGFHKKIEDSKGTKDMLNRADKAGLEWVLYPLGQLL